MIKELISKTINTSSIVGMLGSSKKRNFDFVFKKMIEENGELSASVLLSSQGEYDGYDDGDGIVSECIDCLVTAIDIYSVYWANKGVSNLTILDTLENIEHSEYVQSSSNIDIGEKSRKDIEALYMSVLVQASVSLSNTSVALQMLDGDTYKNPDDYGFKNIDDMISVSTIEYMMFIMSIMNIELLQLDNKKTLIDYCVSSMWEKKLKKWVEKSKL